MNKYIYGTDTGDAARGRWLVWRIAVEPNLSLPHHFFLLNNAGPV
jgi:hypothetical protein